MLNTNLDNFSSNKIITLAEINHPAYDLCGHISPETAVAIGLPQNHFSVTQHYNSGNATQLLLPIGNANLDIYVRLFLDTNLVSMYSLVSNSKFILTALKNIRFSHNNDNGLNRFEFVFTLPDNTIALLWWNGTNIGYDFHNGTTWNQIWIK